MINNYYNRLVSVISKRGKKNTASRIVSNVFLMLKNRSKNRVLTILENSFSSSQPKVYFKSKKIAGAVYKIPKPYLDLKNFSTGSKWLVEGAEKNPGNIFFKKLSSSILDAHQNKGFSLKKKKELHKVALSNRPNLKFM